MYRIYYNYDLNEGLTQIIETNSQKEAKMKFYSQGKWTEDASIALIEDLLAEKGRFYTHKKRNYHLLPPTIRKEI